jgi:dihydroxyacetone kinase phosphoprotein-dependent L subunit
MGQVVQTMAEVALANRAYFSELDAAAGDADFGVSLAAGFQALQSQWESLDRSSLSPFLLKVGMIISSNVGGCSGPIWGTAFMKAGMYAKGKDSLGASDVAAILRSAMEGIMARGGASLGDKTLLDAMEPMAQVFEEHAKSDCQDMVAALRDAHRAVEEAVETTKDWVAKRGRQSFTGERSKGTKDPGMVAIATMLKAGVEKCDG